MWPGPYGDRGSRKYLLASLDQSLKRMGLEYVDIFYSHRFDPDTPLEETMGALDTAVKSGRALYAGISSYSADRTEEAAAILREMGTPLLIHQPSYSMLNRWIEGGLLDVLETRGRRLHRVLAAGPGRADREVRQRDPGRLAGQPGLLAVQGPAQRQDAGPRRGAGQDRRRARPDAGPARAVLGAARPAGDLGA